MDILISLQDVARAVGWKGINSTDIFPVDFKLENKGATMAVKNSV
ncbi:hypothetical protein ACKWMZ_26750 [Pseudomonas protegens]